MFALFRNSPKNNSTNLYYDLKEIKKRSFVTSTDLFEAKSKDSYRIIKDDLLPIMGKYIGDKLTHWGTCIFEIMNKGYDSSNKSTRFEIALYFNYGQSDYDKSLYSDSCYIQHISSDGTRIIFSPTRADHFEIVIKFSIDFKKIEYIELRSYRGSNDDVQHVIMLNVISHDGNFSCDN